MKATSILVVLLIVLMVSLAQAAPHLTIKDAAFDFGFVPQHSSISHTFWLYSTGDDTLKIINVQPGCGCTKAPLKRDVIAVGDSTDLEIIFSTKVYNSRVTKAPKITTNEGQAPKSVRITATVVQRPDSTYPLVMKPYKLDISQFGEQDRDEVKMTITNVSDQLQILSMVDYPTDLFEVKLPERLLPGASAEATLKLTEAGKGIDFEKSFTLEIHDSQTTRFTVPVKRKMRGTANN